ncbi:MAG: PEP-CTERM sorting domain-containing protein [Pirellulales bacterium]|nr:PEP-CTERM sorting domain-containing protein [Pirellulales bacterium]
MNRIFWGALALAIVAAPATFAEDYWGGPPEGTWERGDPGTTWQNWHLCVNTLPDTPDEGNNPYGTPFFEITSGTFEWANNWECPPELGGFGEDGWHCTQEGGGVVSVWIPNTPDPLRIKKMFVQITSTKAPSSVTPVGAGGETAGTWPTGLPQIQWPGPAPFGGSWYTYNYGLSLEPNPVGEWINIEVPYCTVIGEIVVDTICVPEPSTFVLLGCGAIGLLFCAWRRWKR